MKNENIKINMISENLLTIVLNYLAFDKQIKFLNIQTYNVDCSNNDKMTFENFITFIIN